MAGCSECKFYKSDLGDFVDGKFECNRTCLFGNQGSMLKWWDENGHKTIDDPTVDNMKCHDYHDSTKCLINTNKALDKMIEYFKNEQ